MRTTTDKILATAIILVIIVSLGFFIKFQIDSAPQRQPSTNKIQVVTSFYPLYFFTSQITLDKADVYNITPSGSEPHDYEPSTQDIARIEDSSILIINGGKLEAWGDKIKENLKDKKIVILSVGDNLANIEISESNTKTIDPHIWLDPTLAKKEVAIITQGLTQADPINSNFYQTNAQNLLKKLSELDTQYRQGLSRCDKKDIITTHTSFGYLANQYRFNQIAISGLSPDSEPSVQKLVSVADFAKKNQVKYIFFENLVSPKFAQTIASEIGAQTLTLNSIEGLSDEEIKNGKNYFTEMKNNLKNLKIALQCQ